MLLLFRLSYTSKSNLKKFSRGGTRTHTILVHCATGATVMSTKFINYKSTHMHVILVCDLSLTLGFPVLMCSITVDGSHKQFINAFLIGCFIIRGGTCMRYQGEACHVSFNSTLTPYSDSPRFFDNKFWLPATEEFLANGIKIINQLVTNNEKIKG